MVNADTLKQTDRARAEKLRFVARIIAGLRDHLASLMYYPHPFTKGGLVIVFKDDVEKFLERISVVYQNLPPAGLAVHCVRRSELFELSLPSLYLPNMVLEHTHLAYFLKHKGAVLFGLDLRAEVPLPHDPRVLLDNHLEACMRHLRPHGLLTWLTNKDYLVLIDELDKQFRYLMSTALLAHGVWDVQIESLPDQFTHYFANEPATKTWRSFHALLSNLAANDEEACRAGAFEAVWLFECFLRELKEYTP